MSKAQLQSYKAPEATEHVNVNDLLASLELEGIELAKLAQDINGCGQRVRCDCPECRIRGMAVALHREQDCEYARARAALVEEAFALAMSRGNNGDFNRVFAAVMEELSAPLLR